MCEPRTQNNFLKTQEFVQKVILALQYSYEHPWLKISYRIQQKN